MAIASRQLQLWPNHYKPLPDELLGSWIVRLAHAHGYKVEWLSQRFIGRESSIWTRDADKDASPQLRAALRTVTAATDTQIDATTLKAYEGYVTGTVTINGRSSWIAPVTVYHRDRLRGGLSCCPLCLACDDQPYYRRLWRLSFNTVCAQHEVELIDGCPRCGAALTPHRLDVGRDGFAPRRGLMGRCAGCGYDLRWHVPQRSKEKLTAFTKLLLNAATKGYSSWLCQEDLHSVLLFAGLRPVVSGVTRHVHRHSTDFDLLPIDQRRAVMETVGHLFSDPEGPAASARRLGFRYIDIAGSYRDRPLWLERAFDSLKPPDRPHQSPEELESIATLVKSRFGRLSGALARKHFGANPKNGKFPPYFLRFVSHPAYESLLVSLDHQISKTWDSKSRIALLQDKLAIALVRVLGVSASQLSKLTVDEALTLTTTGRAPRHPGFRPVPTDKQGVFDHLVWHTRKIRPRIAGADQSQCLFISCHTARPMGKTAFSNRFTKAVRDAHLTSSIPSMDALQRGCAPSQPEN